MASTFSTWGPVVATGKHKGTLEIVLERMGYR